MRYREPSTPILLMLTLLVAGGHLGCSDGGGSPTAPTPPSAALGSAVIHGGVTTTAGQALAMRTASSTLPRAATGSAAPKALRQATATRAVAGTAGVTVSVQGTGLSTVTDASGAYYLDGVPQGDQTLVFSNQTASGTLPIEDIAPNEEIELDVTLAGSSVTVNHMKRSGGGATQGGSAEFDPNALELQIVPGQWNLNYEHSSGLVTAFIRGEGFERVLLETIRMWGDNPEVDPLHPVSATREGNHVKAQFLKSEVLNLLLDPQPGSVHTVTLAFAAELDDGATQEVELTFDILIVGDDSPEEPPQEVNLTLEIQPSSWNTNWDNSSGTVSALIRGAGFESVDLDSIVMAGDAGEISPMDVSRQGNHVRARFAKSQALGILQEPKPREHRLVTVRFTVASVPYELSQEVKIVGPDK